MPYWRGGSEVAGASAGGALPRTTPPVLGEDKMSKQAEWGEVHEQEVAQKLEEWYSCKVRRWGKYSPIDFWCERDGQAIAVAELKTQLRPGLKFATIAVRKWLALQLWSVGTDYPALFLCRKFTGEIYAANVFSMDARACMTVSGVGGGKPEPMLWVPFENMKLLEGKTHVDI